MTTPDDAVPAPDEGFFGALGDLDGGLGDAVDAGADDEGAPRGARAPDRRSFDRHRVTAVLVTHDGARWLPYVLESVAGLARAPQRVVVVDTGSTDGSRDLVADQLGASSVLEVPAETGFGAAVAHAVEALRGAPGFPSVAGGEPEVEWLWLLHDDCAPEPETLRRLLAAVDASPSVAVAGPKVRGWHDSSRLLEVGVTISGGGRRETGLDRGELDQGQHDGRRDVLAVGTAGMLVRRDVWDALAGLDPQLPLFRDDVDLGWRANLAGHRVVVVPEAVLHHVEAASHGRRAIAARRGGPHRIDRRSAVHVLLANRSAASLPWHWLRLLVGTLLRTLGLLLGKAPREALDELLGGGAALFDLPAIVRGRRRRARTRTLPARAVRPLLPRPTAGLRHGVDVVAGLLSGRTDLSAAGSALESGPTSEEAEDLVARPSRLRALVVRPGVQLTVALLLLSLVAFRGLLYGPGLVQGGALLPAPDSAADLWQSYAQGWHDVGVGSAVPAPPYLAPLAALAALLLGKAWLAVDVVLVLAVPLAGLVAYLVLSRLVRSTRLRVVGALAYALLPATTGAIAAGRLGTAVAAWLLPLVLWVGAGALGLGRPGSLRRAWVAGLLLAILASFAPMAWVVAVLAGLGAVLVWAPTSVRMWLRLLAGAAVAPALLAPWTGHLLADRSALLLEAGAPWPWPAAAAPPSWHVVVANPGGLGVPPGWVTIPVLLAALAGLLRRDRRRTVGAAWAVALAGLAVGLATVGLVVVPPSLTAGVRVWPGTATLAVGGGLVAAGAVGADHLRRRLSSYRFGWRQPTAVVLSVAVVAVPVVLGVDWVRHGAHGVLARDDADRLPAYVTAFAQGPGQPRALVLERLPDGVTSFALVSGTSRQLGDAEVASPARATALLRPAMSDLLAGTGGVPQVVVLQSYGIGYVVVDAPVDPRLEGALDGTPGLARLSSVEGGAVWQIRPPGVRVRLVRPGSPTLRVPSTTVDGATTVDTRMPPPSGGTSSGTLRLADAADPRWTATGDGRPLAGRTSDGWAQAFDVPAGVTAFTVSYDSPRATWLWAEAAVLLVVVVLALPTRRRPLDEEEESDLPDLGPARPHLPVSAASGAGRHARVGGA